MSAPARLRPRSSPFVWLRRNLFATPFDAVLTVSLTVLIAWGLWSALQWAVIDATWVGDSRAACEARDGACWAIVTARWRQVVAGFYPEGHLWRVAAAGVCLAMAVSPVVVRKGWSFALAPLGVVGAFAFLGGGGLLPRVPTEYWGGVFLNFLIGISGAVFALPLGILLALGRRSHLPVIKTLSVGFIEIVRGAPLITLLFMASVVLPLFTPTGVSLDKLTRALVVITLFESAYMAESIRGGLQAVPKGQSEAARALGLDPWRTTALIVLPQALRVAIPAIVNTFIGLFKDTTLVYVIALLDVTGVMRQALADYSWQGLEAEAYVFIALVFWITCFAISRWSARLERAGGRLKEAR
ncbi:amino acid ABC transporter permease [Caulobacter sp. 17J80-11]|uniref:amino acid ABC transporter permease n=1 Tax=Caulobacter sp. 17J80-11 TaxID=2763502 RepID=UPI001653D3C2|nr:amino acid ABC transporter permease [Caulobacter sp. 17J80-11]MBC6980862.1 amino acid ABC transporter permease [Caulobacter sp. 17J80-11]